MATSHLIVERPTRIMPDRRGWLDVLRPFDQSKSDLGLPIAQFEIAPVVGVARFAGHHEYLTGAYFLSGTKKCLLDFDEFVGLQKLLESWTADRECCSAKDGTVVKSARYETRNGLIIEAVASRLGEVARVSVSSPVTIMLTRSQFNEFSIACKEIKSFLEYVRG